MRAQQLDPTHEDPGGVGDDQDDDDFDEWYPPGAACAALAGHALAFTDHLHAALCDYATAVTAALAALAGHGLPARAHVAAGCDLATIELTIPALAATVTDACVRFSDEAGWHYLPTDAGQWARLVPLGPAVTAAALAPPPRDVAAAIAGLRHGAAWAHPAAGEPPAIDALAGPWLDALLAALDAHHCPPPGAGALCRAA